MFNVAKNYDWHYEKKVRINNQSKASWQNRMLPSLAWLVFYTTNYLIVRDDKTANNLFTTITSCMLYVALHNGLFLQSLFAVVS